MEDNILLLLWHPKDSIAGGFIRIQEFLPHLKKYFITVLDNDEAFLKKHLQHGVIKSYGSFPYSKHIYRYNFFLGRSTDWVYAFFMLLKLGRMHIKKHKNTIIYGPTGDNLHIFLAGIILHMLYPKKTKLVLDVLNLELPQIFFWRYYTSLLQNNIGYIQALLITCGMSGLLLVEKTLIRHCDYVVTTSPYMKRVIGKYMKASRVAVTPSGVSLGRITPRKKEIDGLYIGRLTAEKGIIDVIKTWEKVCKEKRDAQLIIAGFGEKIFVRRIHHQIRSLALQKNITLLGTISEKEKKVLLEKSKVFLHLAYFEPLVPVISILEALYCGVPAVIYDMKTIDDYPKLRKNPALIICRNKAVDAVASTVIAITRMEATEREKVQHDSMLLASEYTWEQIVKTEIDIFDKAFTEF